MDLNPQGCVVLIRPTDADVVASASVRQVSKQAPSVVALEDPVFVYRYKWPECST